jgi:hypothetical protein
MNEDVKLVDKVIVSRSGRKFLFPAYALDTPEKFAAKVSEWAAIERMAEVNGNIEALKEAKEMLELLIEQKDYFLDRPEQCQAFYVEKGYTYPTVGPIEMEERKAARETTTYHRPR